MVNDDFDKPTGIIIQDIDQKNVGVNKVEGPLVMKVEDVKMKKWEPKRAIVTQNVEKSKEAPSTKTLEMKIHS